MKNEMLKEDVSIDPQATNRRETNTTRMLDRLGYRTRTTGPEDVGNVVKWDIDDGIVLK